MIESDSLLARSLNWLGNEWMRFLRTLALAAPFLLVFWILDVDAVTFTQFLDWIGVPYLERRSGAVELSLGFYFILLLMVLFRGLGAATALGGRIWVAFVYWSVSYVVIRSIHALTGGLIATTSSWQSPVAGLFGALGFGLAWHLFWQELDRRSKSKSPSF